MKKFVSILFTLVAVMALSSVAFAADFEADADALDIAAKLLNTGYCTVDYPQTRDRILKEVQEYVDALSIYTETPTVKAVIRNKTELVFSLYRSSDDTLDCHLAGDIGTINSFVCETLEYDYDGAADANLNLSSSCCVANQALQTGKAICQGYANLVTVLAEQNGIETIKLRGYTPNGYHVINLVRIDGVIYALDAVYNDSADGAICLMELGAYQADTGFTFTLDYEAAFAAKYIA